MMLGFWCGQAVAAIHTVTNTSDSGAGSLRQAIADAISGDTIDFSLTYPAQINVNTTLNIYKNLTIDGPGIYGLTVRKTVTDPDSVLSVNSLSIDVIIRGLTISGGSAVSGGGIDLANGNLRLENCRITQNSAINGGGVSVKNSASLTAVDTEISHNEAKDPGNPDSGSGGGIFVFDQGSLSLERVEILNNTCEYSGGGVDLSCPGTVTITDSTIADNNATRYGGGIYFRRAAGDGTLVLTDCEITGNTASNNIGGGLHISGSGLEMTRCQVSRNIAGGQGGGLYSDPALPAATSIQNCTFLENTSVVSTGGGAYIKGSGTVVDGCLFQGNAAAAGGGLDADTGTIKNCTFIDNKAFHTNSLDGVGGGAVLSGATAVCGCLFHGNHADRFGGGIYIYAGGPHTIINTTIHENTADGSGGGGLALRSSISGDAFTEADLSFVTITGNYGDYDCNAPGGVGCENEPGGGVFLYFFEGGTEPIINMKSCVVAGNWNTRSKFLSQSYGDLSSYSVFNSDGYNFIGRKGAYTFGFVDGVNNDQVGEGLSPKDSKLMDLADYGGPTYSRKPMPGSPLINAGGPATDVSGNPVTTDHRGKRRPMGSACDIGAVESENGASLTPIYLLLFE